MSILDSLVNSALNTAKRTVQSELNSAIQKGVHATSDKLKEGIKEQCEKLIGNAEEQNTNNAEEQNADDTEKQDASQHGTRRDQPIRQSSYNTMAAQEAKQNITTEEAEQIIQAAGLNPVKDITTNAFYDALKERGADENMNALEEQYHKTFDKEPQTMEELIKYTHQLGKLSAMANGEAMLEVGAMAERTERFVELEEDSADKERKLDNVHKRQAKAILKRAQSQEQEEYFDELIRKDSSPQ